MAFVIPTQIPKLMVLAVYDIVHEQASEASWQILDAAVQVDGAEQVLQWIKDLFVANGSEFCVKEEVWWSKELLGEVL